MGRLRQKRLLPVGVQIAPGPGGSSYGVEVAIGCSGENSPDPGMKSGVGQPGDRLQFAGKRVEPTAKGQRLILSHVDTQLSLKVDSIYESFDGAPMVRRWTRVENTGTTPVGIDFVSSAMLHGMADSRNYDQELRIHVAFNSWMAEGQWKSFKPSEMGFIDNARTNWSEASAYSVGSWSSEKYLPMAMVENTTLGLIWFWQIEHNGSWYWEISNEASRGFRADDLYAYLGGPDDLHADAWKNLQPGQSYETVPVAIGCLKGGFGDAVDALTRYRRIACERPQVNREKCPVIFNDYMNCLFGDPTEAKELPLIAATAAVGCEYYVIDAGWYAEAHEDWSQTIGAWQPSATRWPHGLKFVLDEIRKAGMTPGLWMEPEVAGVHSLLAAKPDSWFFMRHGKRVLKNSRYLLDFRNPEVRAYLEAVFDRLVGEYGVGYIKLDYNVDSLQGTELNADSFGQGLLEHNRALVAWLNRQLDRNPSLILENCGSGGGRMDYAMLSCLQIQSMTDQEDYRRLPGILVGASAAVLPEQLAIWSYPIQTSGADEASFNMVTAMLCRIHQSGRIDKLSAEALAQVREGIRVYKETIRKHIANAVPIYPLGRPDVNDPKSPIALGMRSPGKTLLSVWRLTGDSTVQIPVASASAELLYPSNLGIQIRAEANLLSVTFPRPMMGCILALA
jgi:alpha-galactosidase